MNAQELQQRIDEMQKMISPEIITEVRKIRTFRAASSAYGSFSAPFTIYPSKPSPTPKEMESELFNAIWECIKTWDIKIPEYDDGYMGANGSHVKILMDAIAPTIRNTKLDNILNDGTTGQQ